MRPSDVVTGVLIGCALIALGLTPGLFQWLTDGIQNFRNSLSSLVPPNTAAPTGIREASPVPLDRRNRPGFNSA